MYCLLLLVAGSYLTAGAIAQNLSIAPNQYCFPDLDALLSIDDARPSIILVHNGITLSTTPVIATNCEIIATADPVTTVSVSSQFANAVSTPSLFSSDAGIGPTRSEGISLPQITASAGSTGISNEPVLDAGSISTAQTTQVGDHTLVNNTAASEAVASTIGGSVIPSGLQSMPSLSIGTPASISGAIGAVESNSDVFTSIKSQESPQSQLLPSAFSGNSSVPTSTSVETPATTSVVPSNVAGFPFDQSPGLQNATLKISPAGVDAIQLALFWKNLGVSLYNMTNSYSNQTFNSSSQDSSFPHLIANISMQEQIQQKTLREMLRRTGSTDVTPCKYQFSSNSTDIGLLMGVLKTVEVGVSMSLAESLSAEDTLTAMILSSMSSAAARQSAILHAHTDLNTSMASFETPLSGTWAYNLALDFVQPGSCAVELPIPILPRLSINNSVVGYARSSEEVRFAWDAAGKLAASRSGKPLFIGWVNQVDMPMYTVLTLLEDGSGTAAVPEGLSGTAFAVLTAQPDLDTIDDLTEATLAGPVVVSIVQ